MDFEQVIVNSKYISNILKAMANRERFLILCHLVEGERNVEHLRQRSNLAQSAFSQHLKVLRDANLIKFRKEALRVFYSIADERVILIIKSFELN